jgi:hypothetical protein
MAKAKKSKEETAAGEVGAKPAAAKSGGKKAKAAKAAPPPQPAFPQIDTNLAAAAAAKFVAHKEDLAPTAGPGSGESAEFKQMKQNLHKPAGQSSHSFLQNVIPGKKFNNSVPGRNQQIGRNQTFGADVNRSGVPRRTGG